ncbi:circularly permuted type 2 ATP-grasp protein [Agaribacterium sp. ZY112]|uniref:circularly permuted type 2 ATP-grasp protein n=1 Tax=Agaribacterium sp. ZY112 TaxID=3233574 RepID=UPI003524F5F5
MQTPLYLPTHGLHEEAFKADGSVQPHWQYLVKSLSHLGTDAIASRQRKAERILRDAGATYNVYNMKGGANQSWKLDIVPSIISSEEWGQIEMGLLERAELFNLLLKDIYGPKDLIRTGVIPPEALFLHQGFLRPCQGTSLPGDHQLIFHSTDMVRNADGEICVFTDRTQNPSGAGYALENRTVMSRVLPSLYRDSHVHRLALYFQKLRGQLFSLCTNQDNPRVVILTPGPLNEAYFEHAYLANYLGLHLVQSGDLTVRDGYVWMKSLDGLSRVDVIYRRVDDSFCDPVELRGDSTLGVPNLLEVARSGRVIIANPLGSGVLENPIFLKYLPAISQALLGRELRLKTVETRWLAEPNDLARVREDIDNWVIKPIYRGGLANSVATKGQDENNKAKLLKQVLERPEHYVAQPLMIPSHVPALVNNKLQARPAILRTFSLASDNAYICMPGALTRVGTQEQAIIISNQQGAYSKDTWVVASEPQRIVSNLLNAQTQDALDEANQISLPSRVVENLFWFGRYSERAESLLRILRTIFVLFNNEEVIPIACRERLLWALSEVSSMFPGFKDADANLLENPEQELIEMIADGNRSGSVRANLNALFYCANESKELLSTDMLRVINDIADTMSSLDDMLEQVRDNDMPLSSPEEAMGPLVTALMALAGFAQESMIRGEGWRFMELGKRIERSYQTSVLVEQLLSQELEGGEESILVQALLLSVENLISYRRRYRNRMAIPACLNLVLLDTNNPRSLLFQLQAINEQIATLPGQRKPRNELPLEARTALRAQTQTQLLQLVEISKSTDGQRAALSVFCQDIANSMDEVSTQISAKYFDHKKTSQQLVRN